MSFKTIVVAILSALTAIILYNNKEESSFWLFGDIYTSKLILLSIFYVLGIITGAILFRRKNKHPKEYGVSNPNYTNDQNSIETSDNSDNSYSSNNLSDEDREFIRRD